MQEPNKLTPSQAAELLDISTRTLSRYALAFENSLSEGAGRHGKKRSWDGEDVATIRRAQALMAKGMTISDISDVLNVRPSGDDTPATILSPEQNIVLGGMIERTRQLGDDVTSQDERIEAIETWLRLPWWKKLFTGPTD